MISSSHVADLVRGHSQLESQPASDWQGPFSLPSSLEAFYREIGPVDVYIPGLGNDCFLPRLASLWKYQTGYRWNGVTGETISDWNDDWLVVADEGADPFILSRSSARISLAMHGTGEWAPDEIFPGVNEMAACLAILGGIVKAAGLSLDDESGILSIHLGTAEAKLSEVLGSESEVQSVIRSLGWGRWEE